MTYERWSKSSTDTLGRTVTLFTSVWRPSNKERRNSWASCWLHRNRRRITYFQTTWKWNNLTGRTRGDLLAADEFGSVSLDLVPEVGGADGLVVHRRPQALSQLRKLWDRRWRGETTSMKHSVSVLHTSNLTLRLYDDTDWFLSSQLIILHCNKISAKLKEISRNSTIYF